LTYTELLDSLHSNFSRLFPAWKKRQDKSTNGVLVLRPEDYSEASSFDEVRPQLWTGEMVLRYLERTGLSSQSFVDQLPGLDPKTEIPILVIREVVQEACLYQLTGDRSMSRSTTLGSTTSAVDAVHGSKYGLYIYLMLEAPAVLFPSEYKEAILKHPQLSRYWHEDIWEFGPLNSEYSKIEEKAQHHHVVLIRLDEAGLTAGYCADKGYRNTGDMTLDGWKEYPQHVRDHLHLIILYVDTDVRSSDSSSTLKYPYVKKEPFEVVRIPFGELLKPSVQKINKFVDAVQRVVESINDYEREKLNSDLSQHLVGESNAIQQIREEIERYACEDANVLILGESGTGKELIARGLQERSRRAKERYVRVDCGAISRTLIESQLFGHEIGSHSYAITLHIGYFEYANGGTLFLDEIGNLPLDLQQKLLRAIQEKTIMRVGGNEEIAVDVRIISATNMNIRQRIRGGKFREDLYYRLNEVTIDIPPLRERREDIPLIAEHFLRQQESKGRRRVSFSKEAMDLLVYQNWRGNVRDLLSVVDRCIVNAPEEVITAGFLRSQLEPVDVEEIPASEYVPSVGDPVTLEEIEKHHIELVLKKKGWIIGRAAKVLGIDRTTVENKIEKYGLKKLE
jgi:DNA-binding NtrC family response regulator